MGVVSISKISNLQKLHRKQDFRHEQEIIMDPPSSQPQRGRRSYRGGGGGGGGRFNNHHHHHYPHHSHSHSRGASNNNGNGRTSSSEYYSNHHSSSSHPHPRSGSGGGGNTNAWMLENELLLRDQQIAMFHQRILTLEEKNRNCLEELDYFRHLAQQLSQRAVQQQQEFAAEKEVLVAKAKAETMSQLIRLSTGNPAMWTDPFLPSDHSDDKIAKSEAEAEYLNSQHPLLSSATFHAWVSESPSPCLQAMPTLIGTGIMSDLRDRYEDVKCLGMGYLDKNEKTDWIMKMIRKIVVFYERSDMRVYEEALSNQFVSTLIWCPNEQLCPQKPQSSFSFGYGTTQMAATEAALQHAYNGILQMEINKAQFDASVESERKNVSFQSSSSSKSDKSPDSIGPQKSRASFMLGDEGYGSTQLGDSESLLRHAFSGILEMEDSNSKLETSEDLEESESNNAAPQSQSSLSPKSHNSQSTNESETETGCPELLDEVNQLKITESSCDLPSLLQTHIVEISSTQT